MPQDIEFMVPMESRVSPEMDRARTRHMAWVRVAGLVRSEEALGRYEFSRVADSAAYGFPEATGEDLDLCFDLLGWFFLFDDQFDAQDGRTGDALAACQELTDLLRSGSPETAVSAPVVAAFMDCWQRMSAGMSDEWRRRTVHDWVDYLAGWPTKIADRVHGVLLDPASHLRARRRTIGVRPLLALAERVGHFEVPPLAWCSSHLDGMRIAACDAIIAMNEIHSFEKDRAGGHPNLVLSLMGHRGHSQDEAVRQVRETVRLSVESFLELRSGLPHLSRVLGGGAPELDRYADAHAAWIRGYHDWGQAAPRYTARDHPGDLGLENLVARKPG
ncbi:pentalenene synthase [Streptomyces sp. NPDC051554]|uniref:terpene synthase family protein n=1 Tax=Streptomyces sp. NPDC051554 TaxID=3365656 RepID=UPI00378CAD5D